MDSPTLVTLLQHAAPGAEIESVPSVDPQPTIYVPRDHIVPIARVLRDHPDLRFDFLAELTAADYLPREPRYEVVYILVSTERRHRARAKVRLHGADAHVASVIDVWPAANWLEREVWDLFGIGFDGHPDLRRLLMPEDWEGYPLRKDYPVQIRMPPSTTEPLEVSPEEFRTSVLRDRAARQS
jgi:NADH-quinone oxidoreductase subunit C